MELPILALVDTLHSKGIKVLIDGAHGLGQLDLNMRSIRPDWYVTNAHKWLFTPPGTALIYAGECMRHDLQPPVISHFTNTGFPHSFDYIGTRNYSSWLVAEQALAFTSALKQLGLKDHWDHLAQYCDKRLEEIEILPLNAHVSSPAMRAYTINQPHAVCEQDADRLMRTLWDDHNIQTRINILEGKMILRVSFQAYVDVKDIDKLTNALRHLV